MLRHRASAKGERLDWRRLAATIRRWLLSARRAAGRCRTSRVGVLLALVALVWMLAWIRYGARLSGDGELSPTPAAPLVQQHAPPATLLSQPLANTMPILQASEQQPEELSQLSRPSRHKDAVELTTIADARLDKSGAEDELLPDTSPVESEYCVLHASDLASTRSRCRRSPLALHPATARLMSWLEWTPAATGGENSAAAAEDEMRSGKGEGSADGGSSSPNDVSLYPCQSLMLRASNRASMLRQLGLRDAEQQASSVIVLRPHAERRAREHESSQGATEEETELLQHFHAQYARLRVPPPGWSQFDESPDDEKRASDADDSSLKPDSPVDEAEIAHDDALIFHDRLSWTLFVQSLGRPPEAAAPDSAARSSRAANCPFDLSSYPGSESPDLECTSACRPHHQLLFPHEYDDESEAEAETSGSCTPSASFPCQLSSTRSCDAHVSANAILVPRDLFNLVFGALLCRARVTSPLDLMLELQDLNEQIAVRLQSDGGEKDEKAGKASPAASSVWNRVGPDGVTTYWNSDRDVLLIDSKQQLVPPSVYLSPAQIESLLPHEVVQDNELEAAVAAALDPDAARTAPSDRRADDALLHRLAAGGIRVLCSTPTAALMLPPAIVPHPTVSSDPALQSRSVNASALLPAQTSINDAGWSGSRFSAWVDVQQQGQRLCDGCVVRYDYCRYVARLGDQPENGARWEFFSCALAGDSEGAGEYTEKGRYLEQDGYIARVDQRGYTPLEPASSLRHRMIRRVVYNDGHISWHGCSASKPLCCHTQHASYPLTCRNVRADGLWTQTAPCCQRQFVRMFHHLATLLTERGVEWSLACGTMLAARRHEGRANPYDYDIDIMVSPKGEKQLERVLPELESAGYIAVDNRGGVCAPECPLYRILYLSPSDIHQTTIDVYLQAEDERDEFPLNFSTTFLHRSVPVPHRLDELLERRYPGGLTRHMISLENWRPDPVSGQMLPWLKSSLRFEFRSFNRSLDTITLPPWARALHEYATWDLEHGGVEHRSRPPRPQISVVWTPRLMEAAERAEGEAMIRQQQQQQQQQAEESKNEDGAERSA